MLTTRSSRRATARGGARPRARDAQHVATAVVAAAALSVTGATAQAQQIVSSEESPTLRAQLTAIRNATPTPALAAAIVVDGHVYYAIVGVRRADLEPDALVNQAQPWDPFPIGSISKAYTAAALARAVDLGLIRWDTQLGDVFPEYFPDAVTGDAYRWTRLDALMAHASGMFYSPDRMPADDLASNTSLSDQGRREWYTRYAIEDWPVWASGEGGRNYDGGHIIAEAIFERNAGVGLDAFMNDQMFVPLGMTATRARPAMSSNIVSWAFDAGVLPHSGSAGAFVPQSFVPNGVRWSVGGIASSIVDMARFAYMSMNSPAAPWHLYTSAQRHALETAVGRSDFSPGWQVRSYEPAHGLELAHTGGFGTVFASVRVWPTRRVAIVTATNSGAGSACAQAETWLMDHVADFGAGSDADVIANAVEGAVPHAITTSVRPEGAADLLDGNYATGWTTPDDSTSASLTLSAERNTVFPTFNQIFLDEGDAYRPDAFAGVGWPVVGGYGIATFPITSYSVFVAPPFSASYTLVAWGTMVGPRRVIGVPAVANAARVRIEFTSSRGLGLREVHLLAPRRLIHPL